MTLQTIKVFLLISLIYGTSAQKTNETQLEPYTLDEYLYGSFPAKGWNGTWISDDVFLAKSEKKDVYKVIVSQLKTELFIKAEVFESFPGSTYTVNSDLKYVLIRYNQKSVFRHSTTAQFVIYDIANKKYHHVADKKHLQLAKWSPVGSALVYVFENNIFYIPTPESASFPNQITKDGQPGIVYNGAPDWVYEEEVLASGSAVWFSPNGSRLAFASFDDTRVAEYHYFLYGKPGELENQYPEVVALKYPKVGKRNPTVAVKFVNLDNPVKITVLDEIIPVNFVTEDHILKDVTWATNDDVVAVSLNRVQNLAAITRCNTDNIICKEIHVMEEERGWLDTKAPIYNKNGSKFLTIASEYEGSDSFKHIVVVDSSPYPSRKRLTNGRRVVTKIYGWDEIKGIIYYEGTAVDDPAQQHVYAINVGTAEDVCLTCNFKTPEGPCLVASADFSKKFSYYTRICSGPGPNIAQVVNSESLNFFVWEDNALLRKKISKKLQPVKKTLTVPIADGFEANVRLLLPPGLDENGSTKYPMIVDVYAGPSSNKVSNAYNSGIANYFVTNRKYIYAYIDGRGSGKNGDNLLFSIYRKLGTVEIEDQINVTRYLQQNLPYIDANRTAIWGWSYGGFSTIWALIKDTQNVFRMGLAVAPVTSWIYYDSIYTERYMGLPTPEDNLGGYNNTDATRRVEAMRNKTFFLIHGNADDNVHYQQAMMLAKALERADILFFQQSYPDENHSLGNVSPHLYHTIDRFFDYGFRAAQPKRWKYVRSYKKTVRRKV